MGATGWAFLIDENTSRDVCHGLISGGHDAEHVVDVLSPGASDMPDIIPYARDNDLVLVTKDIADFRSLPSHSHEGIIFINDHRLPPHEIVSGIRTIATAYSSRDVFRGQQEFLDDWV